MTTVHCLISKDKYAILFPEPGSTQTQLQTIQNTKSLNIYVFSILNSRYQVFQFSVFQTRRFTSFTFTQDSGSVSVASVSIVIVRYWHWEHSYEYWNKWYWNRTWPDLVLLVEFRQNRSKASLWNGCL